MITFIFENMSGKREIIGKYRAECFLRGILKQFDDENAEQKIDACFDSLKDREILSVQIDVPNDFVKISKVYS